MGRPQGSKNNPDAHKTGPKPGAFRFDKLEGYSIPEVRDLKHKVLELFEQGTVRTLTEAARKLNIRPTLLYTWKESDAEWAHALRLAEQVQADELEAKLDENANPVAAIFRLKKLRPEYRDNYHLFVETPTLQKLLEELKAAGASKQLAEGESAPDLEVPIAEIPLAITQGSPVEQPAPPL